MKLKVRMKEEKAKGRGRRREREGKREKERRSRKGYEGIANAKTFLFSFSARIGEIILKRYNY